MPLLARVNALGGWGKGNTVRGAPCPVRIAPSLLPSASAIVPELEGEAAFLTFIN